MTLRQILAGATLIAAGVALWAVHLSPLWRIFF